MIYIYIPKNMEGYRPPEISILNFSQLFPVQISNVHKKGGQVVPPTAHQCLDRTKFGEHSV